MNNPPINGSTRPDNAPTPDMTPGERKLWCNSHALDARYLLVTYEEMTLMGESMAQQRQLAGALSRTHKELELNLADYWKNEPDLPNGVAAAVFDAKRYKKAVDLTIPVLRKLHAAFFLLVKKANEFNPVFSSELATLADDLRDQGKELERIAALRRDRRARSG